MVIRGDRSIYNCARDFGRNLKNVAKNSLPRKGRRSLFFIVDTIKYLVFYDQRWAGRTLPFFVCDLNPFTIKKKSHPGSVLVSFL